MTRNSYVGFAVILALILVCIPLIVSCTPSTPGSTSAPTGAAPATEKTLKIGQVSWISGAPGIDWAKQIKAMEAAINKKGGLNVGGEKYLIEVIQYDTNNQMDSAMASDNRLVFEDKVKFIMGESFCDAWAPLNEENKVITTALANGTMIFKPEFKYTFMPCYTTSQQHLATKWFVDKYPTYKNWLLALPDHQFGHMMGSIFTGELKKDFDLNATVEYYPPSQQDLSALGTKVKNINPDVVMSFEMLAMKAIWQGGWKGQFFTPVNYTADYIVNMAGAQAAEGYIGIAGPTEFDPALTDAAKDFKTAYIEKYGKWEDADMAGTAYFTGLLAAIEQAGSLDTDKVATVLASGMKWDSPTGMIQMVGRPDLGIERTVDSVGTLYVKSIKNSRAELIDTIPLDKAIEEYSRYLTAKKPAAPTGPVSAEPVTIEWDQARDHMGQNVIITAKVFEVASFMPPEFLLFVGGGLGQGVGVVIKDGSKWPVDPNTYKDKTVTVSGKVEANPFDGGPQITTTDPAQIVVK